MSVNSIINFITNKYYIINNQLSKVNYFRGNINEYYNNNNLIDIIKNSFTNYTYITEQSIIINDNNISFYISFDIKEDELYWHIIIN